MLRALRFSHVIATKERPQPLDEALRSSLSDLPADGEIVIVDGDTARSAEAVVQALATGGDERLRYIPSASGSTIQRNVGIDAARGEVVVFTDDDCIVMPGFFQALAGAYEDPDVVGATGRVLETHDGRIGSANNSRLRRLVLGGGAQGTMTSYGFRRPVVDPERPRPMQYMPGTLMSARREIAAEVRFDERLPGYALGEDDDFSYRLALRGRILYVPSAIVRHQALGTRTMDRRTQDRLVIVNRTYLFRKNFPQTPRAKLGFAVLILLIFGHRVVNGEWRGVLGLLDGLREVRHARDGHPAGCV